MERMFENFTGTIINLNDAEVKIGINNFWMTLWGHGSVYVENGKHVVVNVPDDTYLENIVFLPNVRVEMGVIGDNQLADTQLGNLTLILMVLNDMRRQLADLNTCCQAVANNTSSTV